MTKKLALIGGGGHALSLLDILPSPLKAAGYVDFTDNSHIPLPYIGDDKFFTDTCRPDDWEIIVTMVSGPSCDLSARRHVIEKYHRYTGPVVIASSAIVSPTATLGVGSAVFHRAVVNAGASVGRHCVINTGAIVEHCCSIGDNVFIGPGVIMCGDVTVGDDSYIGAGTILKPGVTVCAHSIIGAGSVITKDITEPGTYVGSPARRIR